MALALGEIYMARLYCQAGVQAGINVRHYKIVAIGNPANEVDDLAVVLDNALAGLYKNLLSVNASWIGVNIQRVYPLPPTVAVGANANAGPGLVVGDILPGQTAGLISLRTAFAGRSFRGRAYIPFPSESDSQPSGVPSAAYMTSLAAIADILVQDQEFGDPANPATARPVIWSRKDTVPNDITGAVTRNGWATQRRRGFFGRANAASFQQIPVVYTKKPVRATTDIGPASSEA